MPGETRRLMNITIANANPGDNNFDDYVNQYSHILMEKGNTLTQFLLRDLVINFCTGCWSCYLPGLLQGIPSIILHNLPQGGSFYHHFIILVQLNLSQDLQDLAIDNIFTEV